MKEPATLMHSIRQRLLAHFEKSALFAPDDPAMEAAPADSGQFALCTGLRTHPRTDPDQGPCVLQRGAGQRVRHRAQLRRGSSTRRRHCEKIAKTHHAISLLCDNGLEVLIHVGMDTVELKGKGYELFVQTGDHVQKGQLLFRFDMQAIAVAGYTLTTPVIVTNSSRFARIEPLLSGRVTAGQQLLRAKM